MAKKTAKDVMQLIKDNDIKMVDFKMVDINGQYRHVTIPAQNFNEDTMTDGIEFDASNYGYAVVEKSDMVFIPDPDTALIEPFCEIPTLSMTGDAMIIDYPNNRPLAQYPRNIVLAAEEYMKSTGIADTMLILPEFEFYLFDQVGFNRLQAKHDLNNPKSGRVMQKIGMEKEGCMRSGGHNNQGICDLVIYGMLKTDKR